MEATCRFRENKPSKQIKDLSKKLKDLGLSEVRTNEKWTLVFFIVLVLRGVHQKWIVCAFLWLSLIYGTNTV